MRRLGEARISPFPDVRLLFQIDRRRRSPLGETQRHWEAPKHLAECVVIHSPPCQVSSIARESGLEMFWAILLGFSISWQGSRLGHKSLWTARGHCSQPPQRALWKSRLEPGVGSDPLHLWPTQEESGSPGWGQSNHAREGCLSVLSSPVPSSYYESWRQAPPFVKETRCLIYRRSWSFSPDLSLLLEDRQRKWNSSWLVLLLLSCRKGFTKK